MVKQEGEKALQRELQRLTAAGILLRSTGPRGIFPGQPGMPHLCRFAGLPLKMSDPVAPGGMQ